MATRCEEPLRSRRAWAGRGECLVVLINISAGLLVVGLLQLIWP